EGGGVQRGGGAGGAWQTKDGHWIALTAPAQHLFERLCGMLGQPELARDPRFSTTPERSANMREYLDCVEAWFAARTVDEVLAELTAHQVPHAPVMSMADIFADPHFRARDMIIDVADQHVGTL